MQQRPSLAAALGPLGQLDLAGLTALEGELASKGEFAELRTLYDLAVGRAPDPDIGRELMLKAGLLAKEKLGDQAIAETYLRRVLSTDPESPDAIDALRAMMEEQGRLEEAAQLLDAAIASAPASEKVDLLIELAEIAHGGLDQPDRAAAALRYAFSLAPRRLDVLHRARALFLAESRLAEAKAVLDAEADARLGNGAATGEDHRSIAEAYRAIGERLLETPLDHALAEDALERARKLGDPEALSRLDEIAHLRKSWEEKATKLRNEGLAARDKRKAAELYVGAAELFLAYGNDPLRSEEAIKRALILTPGFPPALRLIERSVRDPSRAADAVTKLLGAAADVKDAPTKAKILLRAARLAATLEANNPAEKPLSRDAYRRVLAIEPGHSEAAFAYAAMAERAGAYGEQAEVLEKYLEASAAPHTKLGVHLELGRLYAQLLGDTERARSHFEAVLRIAPGNYLAASALRGLYTDLRHARGVLEMTWLLLEHTPERTARVAMLDDALEVARAVGREETFAVLLARYTLEPRAEIEPELEQLAIAIGKSSDLADKVFELAKRLSPVQAVDRWALAGRLYDRAGRAREAVEAMKRVLDARPKDRPTRDALERLLREKNDPQALADVLESQIARTSIPAEGAPLLAKLAAVRDRELNDPAGARAAFEKMLALDPNDVEALSNLDDLLGRMNAHADRAAIIARREALISGRDRAELASRRAKILAQDVKDLDQAARVGLSALSELPEDSGLVALLHDLASNGVAAAEIAAALEPIYAQRGQHEEQVAALGVLIDVADIAGDDHRAAELAKRSARIYETKLSRVDAAYESMARAATAEPGDADTLEQVTRLAKQLGQPQRAASLFTLLLQEETTSPAGSSAIATALGALYDEVLDKRGEAIEAFRMAIEADPANAVALSALERLLGAEGRWNELAKLMQERMAKTEDRAAKVELGLRIASLQDERAGDLDGAIDLVKDLLALAPGDARALSRLTQLLEKKGEASSLIDVLDQTAAASSDPDTKAALDLRAAELERTSLDRPKSAFGRYVRVLERHPSDETAIRGLELLARDVPALRAQVAAHLVPVYRQNKRPHDLAAMLEIELDATSDRARRRQIYLELAHTKEHELGTPTEAWGAIARAFSEGLIEEKGELVRVALAANQGPALAELLERQVEQSPADMELLRSVARLYDGAVSNPDRSAKAWNRVLAKIPGDAEALSALERLHASGDDPAALAEVLLRRARATKGGDAVALLKRASAIFEEAVEDLPRARDAMEEARTADPDDRNALSELQRLSSKLGDGAKVIELRQAEAELVMDPAQKADVYVRLAGALADQDRFEEAIDAYQKVREIAPDRAVAREGLESLLDTPAAKKAALALEPIYRASAEWPKLVEVYEKLASAAQDPAERVERLLAIRAIWEDRLKNPERAFQAASRAFNDAPAHPDVLTSLERLARPARAHEDLIALYEDAADAMPKGSENRALLFMRLARFLESMRVDKKQLMTVWRRLLAEKPRDVIALDAVVRIGTDTGEFGLVVQALEVLSTVLTEPAQQIEKLRSAARILEIQAGDPTQIVRVHERILSINAGDQESLIRLEGLYAQTGRFRDLERVLTEAASRAQAGPPQVNLRLRLARLLATKLEDPEAALVIFGEVIESKGGGSESLVDAAVTGVEQIIEAAKASRPALGARAANIVEPIWRAKGLPGKLVEAKKAQAEASTDPSEQRRLVLEISSLYEKELDQPEMAFLTLTRLYEEYPGDPSLGHELERLAKIAETREELADVYADAIDDVSDESQVLVMARTIAEIYDKEVNRGPDAIPLYERLLSAAPDDKVALDALERLHRAAKDMRGVVRVLRRRLELPSASVSDRRKIADELAKILESDLGDVEGALEAYRGRVAADPQDRAALVALVDLGSRENRAPIVIDALARLAEIAEKNDEKAGILIRLGKAKREGMKDSLGAVDVLAEALRLKKGAPNAMAELTAIFKEGGAAKARAAEVLAPVLEDNGAFPELIGVLEARLDAVDHATKKALLLRVADIYEDKLGKAEHAFHAICRALHEDLADEALRTRVERLARENTLLEDLAAFFLDEVDQALDHELAVTLRKKAADIYEKDLNDPARAITEHTRVLELLPGDPATLQALERLYKVGGQFQSLAEVYRRRIAQTEDVDARASLMRELARVQSEFLKEVPAAIATLRRLLELAPEDIEALERLAALCARESRPSELADALERLIAACEVKDAPADHHRLELAKLRVEKLDDRVGGDALIRDILARDPHNAPAKAYLKGRLEDAVGDDDSRQAIQVADLLAIAHRQAQEAQPLIEVLRVRASLTADKGARVALHREIAAIYKDVLKQPELAFGALTQAFRDSPEHADLQAEMEILARELVLVEDLVEAYEEALLKLQDPDQRVALQARIGELYETSIGNREKALAAWEAVLRRLPMDPSALEALDRLNMAMGRWGALTDVLEKRLELAEENDESAYDVLMRLGQVWEERLDEKDEAIATYKRARGLQPREPVVLRALARLLDPAQAPDDLYAVLMALADRAEPAELREIYPRLAQLASEHQGDRPQAVELWKRLIEIDPTNARANTELDRLYELDEKWTELVTLLERQLKAARDEKEISRVSRRLALIRGTKLGNVDDAIESWTGILRKNPSDVEALDALRKIYRSGTRWEDLVGILRKLVPLQTNADGVKSIRFELAEIFLGHLNKRDEAIESAKRVLDVEPHSLAQLLRLEEIFVAAGAHHDAVRVMTLRVEQSEDPGEKVDVLSAIAEIYETKLSRKQGAASSYERILQIQPDNERAYEALAAIYQQAGDFRKLVELMGRRLEQLEEPLLRRELLFQIIEVQEKRLGHKDLAFSSACRAFGEEGADTRAQEIAERLAAETDGWEILAEVIEAHVDDVPVPRAVELRKRLAEIAVLHLADLPRAEKQLDLVVSVRPDDDSARAQLGKIYYAGERWKDFIELTLDRVELLAPNVETKKRLLFEIAKVEETKQGTPDAAVRTFRRILDLDGADDEPLDEIIRLLEAQNDAHALIVALEGKASRKDDDGERAAIRARIAQLWEDELKEPSRAIEANRDVLLLDPAHEGALVALERLYTREKRFEDLIEVFERQVELASSPTQAVAFLARIAQLQDREFAEPERAAITLERALEMAPQHVPTMEALEAILVRLGVWSRLVDIYERHLEEVTSRDKSIELLLALGEVQDLRLERRDLAEQTYQKALAKDPSHKEAIHRLGDLFERQGSWFNALEALGKEARLVGSGKEAVEINYRVGKINADMLGDIPGAKVAFKRAIEADATSIKSIRALAELFRDESRWDDVLALEIQEAEATEDDSERATRWQRAAETAFDRLEKPDEAKKLYERALEADEAHVASLRALADLCFIDERYERAESLLEKLVTLLDREQGKDELCRQYYRLAYISEKLGDDEHALTRYLESYEIDSTYLPTLEGLAAALLRAERWQDAQRIYQTILVHHRESLTDAEVVDLYFQLGDLAARLDDHDRARRSYDRALELDPNHVLTLRGYATLTEQLSEWEEAYDHRSRLIDLLAEDDRFDALMLQAKLCREKISDPYRAVDALTEARRLRPNSFEVLGQLSELFQETSQHAKAVDALHDLLQITKGPERRRDLAAQIANVEEAQGNWGKAVDSLNIALDADPLYVKAFERLETLLAQHAKWTQLEENYRKMIERLPKDSSQRLARAVLWKSLGDLYRVKLKSHDGARTAYEVVLKLKPDDPVVSTTLAQLLAQKRDTAQDAIKIYHRLMAQVDDPAIPIREVYPLYEALGQRDKVFCALGAVLIMRVAQPNEQRIYEILLKTAPTVPTKVLDEKAWRLQLFHPDCRTTLADVLSVLYRGAPDLFAEPLSALGLKKKEKIEVGAKGRGGLLYFNVWRIVAQAMGLLEMEHFHRPGLGVPPRLYPGAVPVLFAGENHEVFREMPPKQLAWVISRQIACLRPELAPVRALSPEDVGAAIEGAIRLFLPEGSGFNHGIDPKLIAQWTKNLQRSLGERALKALRAPVQACLERGDVKTLKEYLLGVDHTASRAALLFSGDARVADRLIGEPDRLVEVSDRRRARELMLFSMSEDLFSLRTMLGLALAPAK